MHTRTTRRKQDSHERPTLYIAFELGHKTWCLRFGDGQRVRDVQVPARDLERFAKQVELARTKFRLGARCRIVSCYEAGWDGFWLHRYLVSKRIENVIVDSSSIEVNRRRRRAKTDQLDVAKLLEQLIRHDHGERVWSVVLVPSVADEDARQPQRELERLKKERRRHRNRLRGLLVTQGIATPSYRNFPKSLSALRCWNGEAVAPHLQEALVREWERLQLVTEQIRKLETTRREQAAHPTTPTEERVADVKRHPFLRDKATSNFTHLPRVKRPV